MDAAPRLLGCRLVRLFPRGVRVVGRIVETEAYTEDDPASHTFRGQTPRNAPMFGPAGSAYVYVSYGMHHCLNIVTGREGTGEAVLVRALVIEEGEALARRHRSWGEKPARGLADGPGKLCQALAIGLDLNGSDLLRPIESLGAGALVLQDGLVEGGETLSVTPRVGISKATDWPRRFLLHRPRTGKER